MIEEKKTIAKLFKEVCANYSNMTALLSKNGGDDFQAITYSELFDLVRAFGTALIDRGIKKKDHIGIISDNRKEWIITDLAVISIGAVDVPRGSDSTADEVGYILGHADCPICFAENKTQVEKILSQKERLPLLKTLVVYDEGFNLSEAGKYPVEVIKFQDLLKKGKEIVGEKGNLFDEALQQGVADDWVTLIYTSGTTGEPKGVILTNRSYLFQIERIPEIVGIKPGHRFISVLPVWHSFERAVEYVIICNAAAIAYSKPIGSIMLPDMLKVKPQWMASVPRIWEGVRSAIFRNVNKEGGVKKILFHFFVGVGEAHSTLYNMFFGLLPQFSKRSRVLDVALSIIPLILLSPFKFLGSALVFSKIKKKLGGSFIAGISGGGALPPYVDSFFQSAGIALLEGYGLTETGPVLAVRKQKSPVIGTVGPLLKDIEYRILDKDMVILPPGEKGVLFVKSEQLMQGYYKKPEATEAVLKDGWLNTGDIVMATHRGEIKILGREKDTIVLMGGENIEPEPIEAKLVQSDYIDQAMVVGQDQKFLAALIIPNNEKLEEYAASKGISYVEMEELLSNPEIVEFINEEIQSLVNPKTGFKHFERIFRFKILSKHFEVGEEITHTLKIKRNIVSERYKKEIRELFL